MEARADQRHRAQGAGGASEVLGKTPELVAMHAGLECGVIGEKHPDMQMISFGPHIVAVHSPSERLKISSVEHPDGYYTARREDTIQTRKKSPCGAT
jgi:di/tripeptidase